MQDLIPAEGFTILKTGDSKIDLSKLDAAMAVYGAPVNTIEVTDQAQSLLTHFSEVDSSRAAAQREARG
jgi:hypothetical protein